MKPLTITTIANGWLLKCDSGLCFYDDLGKLLDAIKEALSKK